MVDKNDAMFRELEAEVRREQYAKLWERYGTYLIGFAVAVVAMVGGVQLWESRKVSQAQEAGSQYETATSLAVAGKTEEAAKAFEAIASSGPRGYAALASLGEAGAYMKQEKRAEALAIYDRLSENRAADPLIADFARVQGAALRMGEADFTEMENRLKPLTGDDNAWRYLARELLGTAALKAGRLDEARTLLSPLLVDPEVPRAASERISRLMAAVAAAELPSVSGPVPAAVPAPAADPVPAESPAAAETPAPDASPAPADDAEKPASAP